MALISRGIRSLILLFSLSLLFLGTAGAQPCGSGRFHLYVSDAEGQPVENLTIELLNPASRQPLYEGRGGNLLDRQTARGAQTEFIFRTSAVGGMGRVTIRYTAPGYMTYEETGTYLRGCQAWHGAVLMRSFGAAAVKPSLVGVIRELFFEKDYYDYRDRVAPGRPLRGVTVVAESGGRQFRTVTDKAGRYKFDLLPGGEYAVYPILPKTLEAYDTSGFPLGLVRDHVYVNTGIPYLVSTEGSPQKRAQGLRGVGLAVSVGEGKLAPRVDFLALPSGRIGGLVEGVYDAELGITYSRYLELLSVNPRTREVARVPVRRGYSEPEPTGARAAGDVKPASHESLPPRQDFRFNFYQVPAGKYVIRLYVRHSLNAGKLEFYYPGVESAEQAEVVDFPEGGALTSLSFKLPPLIIRQGLCEVTMPEGNMVDAHVRIVDAAQP